MGTILLYIVYVLEEMVKYWFVYSGLLNLKTAIEPKKYLFAFLIIVITAGANMCFFDISYSVSLIMCGFLCMCLLMQCDWKTKVLAFVPAYFSINFLDTTVIIVMGGVFHFNPLLILETENLGNQISQLLPSVILLGIITFWNRNKKKNVENINNVSRLQYLLLSFGLLCSAMLMSFISYMVFTGEAWEMYWFQNWFTALVVAAIAILVLLVLYVKELIGKQQIQKELLSLYEKQSILQKEYYQRLYEQGEELKKFRHDYHHHLHVLKELLYNKKYKEAVTYIRQLENRAVNYEMDIVYSGNTVVDAVICGVLGNTEIRDLRFEYRGKLKKKIGIEDVDLCTILANVLENAVEACERYYGKRYIRMEIATYKSNLFITVCNPCRQNQKEIMEERRTEKKDKEYHGYGRQNMKTVTEKYNGSLVFEEKEGEFTVKIHLEEKKII